MDREGDLGDIGWYIGGVIGGQRWGFRYILYCIGKGVEVGGQIGGFRG